jgi:hypothetical protein
MSTQIKTIDCVIYSVGEPKKFAGGILGDIDLYRIHLLVDDKGSLIQERGIPKTVEANVKKMLESQDLPVVRVWKSAPKTMFFEVDTEKNPISEQLCWQDSGDFERGSLVWRTIFYPCASGTRRECLGFSAAAAEDHLGSGYTVQKIVEQILGN